MKVAIIHTTPVTVEPMKALVQQLLPGCKVINFMDDSILPQLAENGGNVSEVRKRLVQYAKFAQEGGADAILSACSSVGQIVRAMREHVHIPVVRIDEAMAETAVRSGRRITVVATLQTTMAPTMVLLQEKAAEAGTTPQLTPKLASDAYDKLINGDRDGHDEILCTLLTDLADSNDVVVLAQASMSRVVDRLPAAIHDKFLTSPRLAVERLAAILNK